MFVLTWTELLGDLQCHHTYKFLILVQCLCEFVWLGWRSIQDVIISSANHNSSFLFITWIDSWKFSLLSDFSFKLWTIYERKYFNRYIKGSVQQSVFSVSCYACIPYVDMDSTEWFKNKILYLYFLLQSAPIYVYGGHKGLNAAGLTESDSYFYFLHFLAWIEPLLLLYNCHAKSNKSK